MSDSNQFWLTVIGDTPNAVCRTSSGRRLSGLFGALSGSATLAPLPELLPGASVTRTATVSGVRPTGPMRLTVTLRPTLASAGQPTAVPAPASAGTTLWAWPRTALLILAAVVLLILRHRRRSASPPPTDTSTHDHAPAARI